MQRETYLIFIGIGPWQVVGELARAGEHITYEKVCVNTRAIGREKQKKKPIVPSSLGPSSTSVSAAMAITSSSV